MIYINDKIIKVPMNCNNNQKLIKPHAHIYVHKFQAIGTAIKLIY